ncbi:ABC transporter permease [Desmonostoc muscorum LEGE 12446]|uniref:ABC transporter permease n=1 Tax=Desmonostoc muscorum LEGE 12446 TaxID=1828758 RepID=A0A8J7D1W9_DESMC|nr:ABC transporter permease [Desmonostoc muscorum]MCF2150822.1 ABC transporter permease [Desmonostoc muscorum LEGE 12446]
MKKLTRKSSQEISFTETVEIAAEALWSNKLRTGLTMLGVIIGITSVISITSIGQGVQKSVEQQIQALGTDVLQVSAGAAKSENIMLGAGTLSTLTWEDAKAIAKEAPSAKLVSATLQQPAQIVYGGTNTNTTVYGTDLNYPDARNTHPQIGRYFNQQELDSSAQVVILGPTVQRTLFGNKPALDEKIRIKGELYRVIGIMEAKGNQGPIDRDDAVYIPLTTMSARIVGNNAIAGISVNSIYIKGENQNALVAAQFQIANLLRLRHHIYNSKDDDFHISNQADIVQTFTTVVGLLTLMVVAIAGISLLVGGIGIANIMLVSVVERTREIGIRKALGATNSAIMKQFLVEAIAISTIGGSIGAGTGIIVAYLGSVLFKFPFVVSVWSIVVGFGLSAAVGLAAGLIPARNAAKLDPIVALRSE